MSTPRPTSRFTHLLLTLLLLAALGGWAHAAVHAGDTHTDTGCAACQWAKHSPGRVAASARPVAVFVALTVVVPFAPVAPGGATVDAPTGRAPPRTA